MLKINTNRKNGRITKLFILPEDAYLIEDVKILYPDEYIEIYIMQQFTCDYTEFFCYDDLYTPDLTTLLVC